MIDVVFDYFDWPSLVGTTTVMHMQLDTTVQTIQFQHEWNIPLFLYTQ